MLNALMIVAILVMLTIAVLGTEVVLLFCGAALILLAVGCMKLFGVCIRTVTWCLRQITKARA